MYFVYFIDLFTRFSRAQVIHRETRETVMNVFITSWIANGLGAPGKVLVDNGGEFDNSLHIYSIYIQCSPFILNSIMCMDTEKQF